MEQPECLRALANQTDYLICSPMAVSSPLSFSVHFAFFTHFSKTITSSKCTAKRRKTDCSIVVQERVLFSSWPNIGTFVLCSVQGTLEICLYFRISNLLILLPLCGTYSPGFGTVIAIGNISVLSKCNLFP